MQILSTRRGHKVKFIEGKWYYADTGELADYDRACIRCKRLPTKEGFDACIGYVPYAKSICCGHGVTEPIIKYPVNSGETKMNALFESIRFQICKTMGLDLDDAEARRLTIKAYGETMARCLGHKDPVQDEEKEDYLAELFNDWNETRMDAQQIGIQ